VRNAGPADNWADKAIYFPVWLDDYSTSFAVRFDRPERVDLAAVRRVLHEEAPEWPPADVQTMRDVIAKNLEERTLLVQLLGMASALALLLALVGVHGVLGYQVARRTRELGIRFALGASTQQVTWMVMREGLLLAGLGSALGLGGAFAGARVIANQFPDTGAAQPLTLLAAVAVLLVAAALACLQPALAAARIQPTEALRSE
jgi:ABC-type antimicrobial peptide transport system permease subunit